MFVHRKGFVVLNDCVFAFVLLYDEGTNGGGRVEPLVVKAMLFDEDNCSSVGGRVAFVNGFCVRVAFGPNGFVPEYEMR